MWYRQEGELIPFTSWPWMRTATRLAEYFPADFRQVYGYFKKDYGWFYWNLEAMHTLAKAVFEKYGKDIDKIYSPFIAAAQELEQFYLDAFNKDLFSLSEQELIEFYNKIWDYYHQMWSRGLFIDAFDPGFDEEQIDLIARKHSFTIEEAALLTTPTQLTYASERRLDFLRLVREVPDISYGHQQMQEHIKKFDYYQHSYAYPTHITQTQVEQELEEDPQKQAQEYEELLLYEKQQNRKIQEVLGRHALPANPLRFFQTLTYWREHRKKVNMMGCHVLHRLLDALSTKTGTEKKYLEYLNYDEVDKVLQGDLSGEELQRRYNETVLLIIERDGYACLVGKEARREHKKLEESIKKTAGSQIRGTTACWGKVQGKVKIVLNRADFDTFNEGDILVAGMTRPEHVPLMKKAAAIVTNEGGITCHAAIVSRELGKPCIIGTRVATEILKDGDLVEVNANHGVVRKL